jgi:hypothetical protein
MPRSPVLPVLVGAALLAFAAAAPARAAERSLWVDPVHGHDSAAGTRAHPLRSVDAAWRRVPQGVTLHSGYRIRLRAGRYRQSAMPTYWEQRRGTAVHPITLESADGPGRAVVPPMNVFRVDGLVVRDVRVQGGGDVFHCERCRHLLLDHVVLKGTRAQTQETLKVNQSSDVTVRDSVLQGANDNALDFFAVTGALIERNVIGDAEDWCAYAKGGSAGIVVTGNRFTHCGTGGFTAGQGSGDQFMFAPFLQYEAVGVEVVDNTVDDVEGAAFGVQGGYDVLIARNVARGIGSRSHLLEVGFGLRSCDGRPGDPGRERCAANLRQGGWGTTVVDDGTNAIRIPNRHVFILDNVLENLPPAQSGYQQLSVFGATGDQPGSGVPAGARADDDLQIAGNVIWNGPADWPLGVGDDPDGGCPAGAAGCSPEQILRDNAINVREPELTAAPGGRLARSGWTAQLPPTAWPAPRWDDRPAGTPVVWRAGWPVR